MRYVVYETKCVIIKNDDNHNYDNHARLNLTRPHCAHHIIHMNVSSKKRLRGESGVGWWVGEGQMTLTHGRGKTTPPPGPVVGIPLLVSPCWVSSVGVSLHCWLGLSHEWAVIHPRTAVHALKLQINHRFSCSKPPNRFLASKKLSACCSLSTEKRNSEFACW